MKSLLYVTDLYYDAQGRDYAQEDIFLTSKLRETFNLTICHPRDTEAFEGHADLIVFRNAGPVANYKNEYAAFKKRITDKNLKVYNSFDGKGDMRGKDYLIELSESGYPVIPTIDSDTPLSELPKVDTYIVKPKDGADSIGLEFLDKADILNKDKMYFDNMLIQPLIDFEYEVSFYFIDHDFQYALYAPDTDKRWMMKEYLPTQDDMEFAKSFIDWNDINWGIQRVDACRSKKGELLLVELEDLNPYLSLAEDSPETQEHFIETMKQSLTKAF
jgi:hypothetical protein